MCPGMLMAKFARKTKRVTRGRSVPNKPDTEQYRRPSAEQLLILANREERKRGRLKIFLGFAAGVGKTYEMLSEANRRKCQRGQDVVIGYLVTHGRKGTEEQVGELEIISRRNIEYRGTTFEEMDTDA